MITILTADGRTLSYDETEEVMLIGTFDGTYLTARRKPVLDVQPGNWLYLGKCSNAADRDYDLVLVRNIAGKPLREIFAGSVKKTIKAEARKISKARNQ